MILLIDNQDSFTYNLFQAIESLGRTCLVVHAEHGTPELLTPLCPEGIILSPGPGNPAQAIQATQVVKAFAGKAPILGVCLGHQIIGACFGAAWGQAKQKVYGKAKPVNHTGQRIFSGLPQPFDAARYHSLCLHSVPAGFEQLAHSEEGECMAIAHQAWPIYGVQFHLESFMSPDGLHILSRFFDECPIT